MMKGSRRIRPSTIINYTSLRVLLKGFSEKKKFPLRIMVLKNVRSGREYKAEKKYCRSFYLQFTNYLFYDRKCFDNYVGSNIKVLRVFFNYLVYERELNIGLFYKKFDVLLEEIEIIVLLQSQLQFLITNKEFEASLPDKLKKVKDFFVFGCTVALRISDLMALTKANLEIVSDKYYLRTSSKKTETFTRVLLPPYVVEILKKYAGHKKILPRITKAQLNVKIKELIELANWNEERIVIRHRRGEPIEIYKNEKNKTPYRFCDLISSHTMRRTAITTLLCLNVPENVVRKISGHAPNSKEFYKYVELSQKYMDGEIEKAHKELIGEKSPLIVV